MKSESEIMLVNMGPGVSTDSDSGPEHKDITCYGPTDTCLSVKLESEPAYTALLERNNEMAEVYCDMSEGTLCDSEVDNMYLKMSS